ncbi:hypothetical protein WP50_15475, partial [Lactiplantibacillus plantarum]
MLFSLTANIVAVLAGALFLGYTSANIWPYYLTIKLHLSAQTDFKLKKIYWLIFLVLGSLTANIVAVLAGALFLGYTSANIWPYYLTIKLHLSAQTDFKLKKIYWLIFLVLGSLPANFVAVLDGDLFLGYTSANIWPYYLT